VRCQVLFDPEGLGGLGTAVIACQHHDKYELVIDKSREVKIMIRFGKVFKREKDNDGHDDKVRP
jgi:hypothetical protein